MKQISILFLMVLLFAFQSACTIPTPQIGQITTPTLFVPPSGAETLPPDITLTVLPPPLPTPTASSPIETPLPSVTLTILPPPLPTPTASPTVETPPTSPISLELLKNFSYWIEDFNTQVTLVDGVYSDDQVTSWLVEPAGFGDLNGDGLADAAVVLTMDPSGSGTFYYLTALLNQNGTPVQAGSSYIGDRQVIQNLQIGDGRVVLDYLTQGLNDPSCCPSEHRLRSYLLENGALRLASEQVLVGTTPQATPLPNAILIDQPVYGDPLISPLQVSGRVSQMPPERMLAYYITDLNAVLLAEGEIPLEGEPGGPGTFAFEITLDSVSPSVFQLELVDAAQGILRGRSTVVLLSP